MDRLGHSAVPIHIKRLRLAGDSRQSFFGGYAAVRAISADHSRRATIGQKRTSSAERSTTTYTDLQVTLYRQWPGSLGSAEHVRYHDPLRLPPVRSLSSTSGWFRSLSWRLTITNHFSVGLRCLKIYLDGCIEQCKSAIMAYRYQGMRRLWHEKPLQQHLQSRSSD